MFRELREKSRAAGTGRVPPGRTVPHRPRRPRHGPAGRAAGRSDRTRPVMVLDSALRPIARARWPEEVARPNRGFGGAGSPTRPPVPTAGAGGRRRRGSSGGDPHRRRHALSSSWRCSPPGSVARRPRHPAMGARRGSSPWRCCGNRGAYEVESRLKGDVLQDLFTGSYHDEEEAAGACSGAWVTPCHRRLPGRPGGGPPPPPATGRGGRPGGGRDAGPPVAAVLGAQRGVRPEGPRRGGGVAPWRSGFLLLLPAAVTTRRATSR